MQPVRFDPFRKTIFPNRIRDVRRAHGFLKLITLATRIEPLTYIRLSKIERGEVFARPDELRAIGQALDVPAEDLLIDIDDPDFSLEQWVQPFVGDEAEDADGERRAVLIAAAVRQTRVSDRALTIAEVSERFGIAPVNLSRIENAQRRFGDWNAATRDGIRALLDVRNDEALEAKLASLHRDGTLDPWLERLGDPAERLERSRARIAELRAALASPVATMTVTGGAVPESTMLPVIGIPGPDGLILPEPTGSEIESPTGYGIRLIALRMCRPTLGGTIAGQSILFVDPARYPIAGGLAALMADDGYRIMMISSDEHGQLWAHSLHPAKRIALDDLPVAAVAAVVAARFI